MPRKRNPHHVAVIRPAGRAIVLRYFCPIARRQIRKSTGTTDLREARRQAKKLEAELMTGTYSRPAETTWLEFVERYDREVCKPHLSKNSRHVVNEALNAYEKIMRPDLLSDVTSESLDTFRRRYAAGEHSRFKRPRSPYTVSTRFTTIMTALRWAEALGLLKEVPKVQKFRTTTKKKSAAKGRPLAGEEIDRLLEKTAKVVGAAATDSWKYLIRGLLESGLRLDEALHCSWDIPGTIRPVWRRGALPSLLVPLGMQKNGEEDEIPLLPGFEALLLETPEHARKGWIFEPVSLQEKYGRKSRGERPLMGWVSKILSRIGEEAGVIVEPGRGQPPAEGAEPSPDYRPPKYASAHDLRRTCADRLEAAGVPPAIIGRVLRHKSFETTKKFYAKGDLQRDAGILRSSLITGLNTGHESKPNRRKSNQRL